MTHLTRSLYALTLLGTTLVLTACRSQPSTVEPTQATVQPLPSPNTAMHPDAAGKSECPKTESPSGAPLASAKAKPIKPPPNPPEEDVQLIEPSAQHEVIEGISRSLVDGYVFAEVGQKMAHHLR